MSVTKIIGWVLSGLLALLLIGLSAPGKFMEFDGKAAIGLFDGRPVRIASNGKDFVVVAFFGHGLVSWVLQSDIYSCK